MTTKFISLLFFFYLLPLLFVDYSTALHLYYNWTVSFSLLSPLGVENTVIAINNQFPGPLLEATTNDVVNVNIYNNLSEPFLMTWNGIQMRKNSWQDGVEETNCPIQPAQNWTYTFQLKDQIGSYFYFPSLLLQKAAGGYGPIRLNNRAVIPLPFPQPDYDFNLLIGDWYNSDHQSLRANLSEGGMLPLPDGILINGRGTNQTTFDFERGGIYRLRISNVGLKTSINFQIQKHKMLLVETEGTYTLKQHYKSLDIHVGQSYSVLVEALNRTVGASFFVIASSRFIPRQLVTLGLVRYLGFEGEPVDPMPSLLQPYNYKYSYFQALSIRMDLSVGGARPNPQGSYHYGSINVTRLIYLKNDKGLIDGKNRYMVNGVSYAHSDTPLKLADYFNISDIFENTLAPGSRLERPPRLGLHVIDTKYHDFVHVVFQNVRPSLQTWHSDGYNFFIVGMGRGAWDKSKTRSYNMADAIYRSTVQVYPMAWTSIMFELDNMGMWNLRSQDAEKWYLGQQLYLRVKGEEDPPNISPRDEYPIPPNLIRCGRALL